MKNKTLLLGVLTIVVVVVIGVFLRSSPNNKQAVASTFSTDTAGLPEAKPSETVELKNGDTYNLTASIVKKKIGDSEVRMLAYNGMIPGPLIKVAQGSEVTINFTNNIDAPTLLHSHGVRMDNAFDGLQTSQKEMKPGETFAYKIKFPDAGMFWYHPHVREDYQQQSGLYGNYLVTPTDQSYWSPVNNEVTLFLSDISIENGNITPFSTASADHTLMGRYGNVQLVNGVTDYMLSVKKGEVDRFYVTNAANARPFNFAIAGAKLKLVGADGSAYEKDQWKDSVIISPSERAIVEVLFDKSGTFAIQNKTPDQAYTLGTINVSSDSAALSYAKEFSELRTHTATVQSVDPLRSYFDKAPDKQINLTLDMGGNMMSMQGMGHGGHMMPNGQMMGGSMMEASPDGIEWNDTNQMMNQMSGTDSVKWKIVDQATGKENENINWTFKKDAPVKIRIFNDPNSMHPMQHPIHFHGQQFLVLAVNGVKQTDLAWKDTVLVPSGQTIDILLNPTNPGEWMAHCHIAEHLEAGMMLKFKVE